jgi:dTDP-4-dehydrorhamnose 3,5-epimerase
MEVVSTAIPDVKVLRPPKFVDRRGFFSETYNKRVLAKAGIDLEFVQDNHALSVHRGVLRGLHFQIPPVAQHKLVRVIRGAVFDVAVDLRKGSPTFGKHVAVTLSAEEWNQLLVPVGFAHGFCTLADDTEVAYKMTDYYSPEHERGIIWNDPALGISWPVSDEDAILSEKDRQWPAFSGLPGFFELQM